MPTPKYIELVEKGGYQYVTRLIGKEGAVVIIPMLAQEDGSVKLQLIVSKRPTFDKPIIEFPAGLLDDPTKSIEEMVVSELKEETGWDGVVLNIMEPSPSSAGITDELLHIAVVALTKQGKPNHVGGEKITVLPLMTPEEIIEYGELHKKDMLISSRLMTYMIGFSVARAMYIEE